MIRYDVLYKKLYDHIRITLSNASFNAGYNAATRSGGVRPDEYLVDVLRSILKESDREFDKMQKRDEEAQHVANVTLQEILQELKKLNKGKEEEEDGLLDDHGDGVGADAVDQGNTERDQPVSTGTRGEEKRFVAET